MKKADNFDASKWLTENKITTQSRLNEMATMIKKNSPFGSEKPLQVGDTIMWKTYSNDDRGMGSSVSGRLIGKVVKILGTANLQAEDIKTGDLYKVSRTELTRVPNVGDKIEATLSYNSGAGSGSQGSNKISGIVKKVNPEKFSMIIQTENSDKPTILDLKDLSDVKIYGLNESRLKEALTMNPVESIEKYGFVKIRNREEYLQAIPVLTQAGYSLVGDKFPTKVTPFDAGYGQRRQPRKNSIYLIKYWGEDENKEILYDKYLWIADVLDKNDISDRFPIGKPYSLG